MVAKGKGLLAADESGLAPAESMGPESIDETRRRPNGDSLHDFPAMTLNDFGSPGNRVRGSIGTPITPTQDPAVTPGLPIVS